MERKGLSVFCLRQLDAEIAGSVIRSLSVSSPTSLSFYQLASHPHYTLLTGYTANGHPYRFYNSIYVNTHLSNDWSGFELNPFPLSNVLPRTPSRFWPSFSASHPTLVRCHPTGDGERERRRWEKEKEKEKDSSGRRKRARERVEAECISPHYTDYVPLANISHCIAYPRKNPTERALIYPISIATWYLTFFCRRWKKVAGYGQRQFSRREIRRRMHGDVLIGMRTCENGRIVRLI